MNQLMPIAEFSGSLFSTDYGDAQRGAKGRRFAASRLSVGLEGIYFPEHSMLNCAIAHWVFFIFKFNLVLKNIVMK